MDKNTAPPPTNLQGQVAKSSKKKKTKAAPALAEGAAYAATNGSVGPNAEFADEGDAEGPTAQTAAPYRVDWIGRKVVQQKKHQVDLACAAASPGGADTADCVPDPEDEEREC